MTPGGPAGGERVPLARRIGFWMTLLVLSLAIAIAGIVLIATMGASNWFTVVGAVATAITSVAMIVALRRSRL